MVREKKWVHSRSASFFAQICAKFYRIDFSSIKRGTWVLTLPLCCWYCYIHFCQCIFCSKSSGFRDTCWFSILPLLNVKHGHWQKFHKLHTYSLSGLEGRNSAYFCSLGSGFCDTGWVSKLAYLSVKLGHYQKFKTLRISFPVPPYIYEDV